MESSSDPWRRIAHGHGKEWFRDNPDAPWGDFYRWAAEEWEPQEFFRAGHGRQPGQSVDATVLADAHLGLAAAVEDEWLRRQAGNMPRPGHVGSVERLTARSAPQEAPGLWWEAS